MIDSVEDELSVSLAINGVTLSGINSKVSQLKIFESISNEIPSLNLEVLLKNEFMINPVFDGSLIELRINFPSYVIKSGHYRTARFRVYYFEAHEVSNEFGLEYSISAMAETYYKLNSIEQNAYTGNSTSVFSAMGDSLKISTDLGNTNDLQTWFPADGNRINFLRHTCLHSWKDNESVFCWWVDRYNTLCLKNLTEGIKNDTKWIFIHNRNEDSPRLSNMILVNSMRYISTSGENNTAEGYGKNNVLFDQVENAKYVTDVNKFYSGAEAMNLNKDVAHKMRYNQLGIKTTNTHDNYHIAEMQNKRGRSLYSINAECFSTDIRDVLLGDTVYYEMSLGSELEGKVYSGKYIIIGIETILAGKNSMAKYTLARQGITVSPVGKEIK